MLPLRFIAFQFVLFSKNPMTSADMQLDVYFVSIVPPSGQGFSYEPVRI